MEHLTATMPLQYVSTRLVREPTFEDRPKLTSSDDVAEFLKQRLDLSLDREVLGVITLSPMMQVNVAEICSIGTIDAAMIHVREVYKSAITSSSVAIILFHTHPSSDSAYPSMDDLATTKRMVEAGKILGINFIDHIIIAGNGTWTSLKDMAGDSSLITYINKKGKETKDERKQ